MSVLASALTAAGVVLAAVGCVIATTALVRRWRE